MENIAIQQRLKGLRDLMQHSGIDAYIIPSNDPHISEYPAEHWKCREWISGFSGSAGTVIVTESKAGLWTDSRYFLQAEAQLDGTGIDLYRQGLPGTMDMLTFLLSEVKKRGTVGFDGQVYSVSDAEMLGRHLERKQITMKTDRDLVGELWNARPAIPENPVFLLPEEFAGKSVEDKLIAVNNELHRQGADCTILAALDEIAWLFNLRGTDVEYNPVAITYAFVSEEETVLFVNPKKLSEEVVTRLKQEGVLFADYNHVNIYLGKLSSGKRVLVDPKRVNIALFNALPSDVRIVEGVSPIPLMKGVKNETELKGFRNAVVKDGVALVRFLKWLEEEMQAGHAVTEMSASAKLTSLRSEQPLYVMDSFATICGYASHGAIVHYEATPETDAELKPESLLLIDSGAQYFDGTTDITRTIALGTPTEAMMKDYTKVLKGTISLAKCKFPVGTRGSQLDILARKALWDSGLNYLHGTGHGIGHCLNVHEGPQSIRMEENPVALQPGMVISDEPGLYRAGEYGIRIENMILVRSEGCTEFGEFLSFETLTLCPIDTRPIIVPMLSVRERIWLNKYHQEVYEKLSPYLTESEREWLKVKTEEI